jgi:hypothetical protein
MTDAEMYEILNDFAKQHALAEGLEVNVTPGGMSFKTVDFTVGGKYEYSHMLGDMIRGAEQLLMWARRTGRVNFRRVAHTFDDKYINKLIQIVDELGTKSQKKILREWDKTHGICAPKVKKYTKNNRK